MKPAELLQTVLAAVDRSSGHLTRSWFAGLAIAEFDQGVLRIAAANADQLTYLARYCGRPFSDAAQHATGMLVSVAFCGPDDASTDEPPSIPVETLTLAPQARFEAFLEDPNNRLACASAVAATHSLGQVYNPLVVHGPHGVGKTHLLQAVCHRSLDLFPALRVAWLTSEQFAEEFVAAIGGGQIEGFRAKYRSLDLLALDDIEFLARREAAQQEFFHTFNSLHEAGRQMVVAASRPPNELAGLEERLTSRLNWGLVVAIDRPGAETCLALLRRRSAQRGLALPDAALQLAADRLASHGGHPDELLDRLSNAPDPHDLSDLTGPAGPLAADPVAPVQFEDILAVVTRRYGVRSALVQGPLRARSVALPRQICMHLARRLTPHSLGEIGRFFGDRDHSTVLHADRLIAKKRESDARLGLMLNEIEAELRL